MSPLVSTMILFDANASRLREIWAYMGAPNTTLSISIVKVITFMIERFAAVILDANSITSWY